MQHLRHPRVTIGPARLLSDLLEDAWPLHRYAARCMSVHRWPTAAAFTVPCEGRRQFGGRPGLPPGRAVPGDPYDPPRPGIFTGRVHRGHTPQPPDHEGVLISLEVRHQGR
jgi:hypothetical protein